MLRCFSIKRKNRFSRSLWNIRINTTKNPSKHHTLLPSHTPIVSTPKMLSKTIILILVVVALFATMTMARNLQANADDSDSLDEPRFSLRQVLSLVNGKRTSVRMSRLLCAKQNRHSSPWARNMAEPSLLRLFTCHMAGCLALTSCLYANVWLPVNTA